MPRFGLQEQFNLEGPYNRVLPETYEGWSMPRQGPGPFKIIDDPEIIKRKNAMRNALRDEYTKRMYNPYRAAAGIGGTPTDPMIIRYNAMMRTQYEFFRAGPKSTVVGVMITFGVPFIFGTICESIRAKREHKYRTGQIAYKDREGRCVK